MDLRPDLGAAVMLYLKDCYDLTIESMAYNRIYLQWPEKDDAISVPTTSANFLNLIMIEAKRGGPGEIGSSLIDQRVIIKCYGKNKLQASVLWRALDQYLMKPDGRTKTSFVKANTRVLVIFQESGPNELVDPSAGGWPFVECSYIFRHSGIKIPVE